MIKKNIIKIKLKVAVTEINLINGFNSRLDKPEERISELDSKSELIFRIKHRDIQGEKQREKL